MWDSLPWDLQEYILHHRAAQLIRARWIRHHRFGHARKKEWKFTRECITHNLGPVMFRSLYEFSLVRREWRREPHSWRRVSPSCATVILEEAVGGLWGMVDLECRVPLPRVFFERKECQPPNALQVHYTHTPSLSSFGASSRELTADPSTDSESTR